jgi:WD40 repeat protein
MKTILIVLFFTSTFLCFSQSVYKQWEKGYGPKDMVLVENDEYVIAYFTNGAAGTLTKISSSTGLIEAEIPVKPNPKWYSHTNLLLNTIDDKTIIYMTGDTKNTGFYLEYYNTGNLDLIRRKHFLFDTSIADSLFEKRLVNFIRSVLDSKNEKLYTVIKNDYSIDTTVVVVYNVETGEEISRIPYEFGNNEKVNIALSPDETRLVTYSTGLEYIKVWDLNTMELLTTYPPKFKQTTANNFTTPVDVKFSTMDPDIIYILGMRGYRSNERRGIYKYSISKNDIIKEISQGLEIDTQKLMFFDNEKRILRFNERILNIFNLVADSSEYFKHWGYTLPLEMNVVYSEWHDLFIVSDNRNMYGIRYFRP